MADRRGRSGIVLRVCVVAALTAAGASAAVALSSKDRAEFSKACGVHRDERGIHACTMLLSETGLSAKQRGIYLTVRGTTYRDTDKYDEAIADYLEAIRVDPKNENGLNGLGSVYTAQKKFDKAIDAYDQGLRINPKSASLYANLAGALSDQGKLTQALETINRAIKLESKDSYGLSTRATIYNRLQIFDSALEDCAKAKRLDKRNPYAFLNCGRARAGRGELDAAIAEFDEALRISPINWRTRIALAGVYRKRGEYDKAIVELEKAQVSPRDGEVARLELAEVRALVMSRTEQARPPAAVEAQGRSQATAPEATTGSPLRRVALVIGNSDYASTPRLDNPRRDAEAVADAFRRIGFSTVTVELDVSRATLIAALRKFEAESEGADWGVIYYAGHGIEVSGENYVIPVEAELKADKDVEDEAVPLTRVLKSFGQVKTLGLVILDACRNNPFKNVMRRTIPTRAVDNGLARVEPRGNVLVAYAAKDGETALDGSGTNSPYVTALVARLVEPNVEIRKLLGLVRDDVLASTGSRQEPYIYGSLGGRDYILNPR